MSDDWFELARHPAISIVLDLDQSLIPSPIEPTDLDRGLALLFEALHLAGARVVVLSGRSQRIVERFQADSGFATWTPRPKDPEAMRATLSAIRRERPGTRLIVVADAERAKDLLAALEPSDAPVVVGSNHPYAVTSLATPGAVRAMMWWVADTRAGATGDLPLAIRQPRLRPRRLLAISCELREHSELCPPPLEAALLARDGAWLGWSGSDGPMAAFPTITPGRPMKAAFDISPILRERFHARFCRRVLDPLFQGAPYALPSSDDWRGYVTANELYAKHAVLLTGSSSPIWVHDYPLMLVADALRAYGHRGPIGLLLHDPFPSRARFHALPWSNEIVRRMLEFDLIGLQSNHCVRNFEACVDGRIRGRLRVGVFPSMTAREHDSRHRWAPRFLDELTATGRVETLA